MGFLVEGSTPRRGRERLVESLSHLGRRGDVVVGGVLGGLVFLPWFCEGVGVTLV